MASSPPWFVAPIRRSRFSWVAALAFFELQRQNCLVGAQYQNTEATYRWQVPNSSSASDVEEEAGNAATVAAQSLHLLGYSVLRGVLSREEAMKMRQAVQECKRDHINSIFVEHAHEPGQPTALSMAEPLMHFPQLAEALKPLTENPALHSVLAAYFGDTFYRTLRHSDIGINRRVAHWHKDLLAAPYDEYQKTNVWSPTPTGEKYAILKVDFYMQDHRSDDLSLRVVPGSHRKRAVETDPSYVTLHPALGDIVLMDQRVTHRGTEGSNVPEHGVDRILFAYAVGPNNVFSVEHEQGSVARQNFISQAVFAPEDTRLKYRPVAGEILPWARPCDGAYCCLSNGRGQHTKQRLYAGKHELTRIAHKYRDMTDKAATSSSRFAMKHSHTDFYGPLFNDARTRVEHLLEVGVGHGGSLAMWRDFFPNAHIWGVDVDLDEFDFNVGIGSLDLSGGRVIVTIGNVFQPETMYFPNVTFDIIINDSLNGRQDHHDFLLTWIKKVRPGGWIVLEGVATADDARWLVENFGGDSSRLSIIDRTSTKTAFCNDRLVVYAA